MLSEMCLQRNYNSIKGIEKEFGFEILFSLMKSNNIVDEDTNSPTNVTLKARIVELMLRVHVDREPLERMFFPIMIKTTDDIEVFDKVNIINYEPERRMLELKEHILD